MPRRRRPPRAGAVTELPPLRILGQMAALQALYYTAALVLMLFTSLVAGRAFALDLVFGWEPVRGDTTQGWLVAFVWVLDGGFFMWVSPPLDPNSPSGPWASRAVEGAAERVRVADVLVRRRRSLAMVLIVVRSKLVPDFALTVHFVHLLVVFFATGKLPRHMMWWLAMAASSALAVGLGIWGCRYRELRPISFGGGGGGGGAAGAGGGDAAGQDGGGAEDEEQGYARGRGRGRGKDGGGDYEMVHMNGTSDRRED